MFPEKLEIETHLCERLISSKDSKSKHKSILNSTTTLLELDDAAATKTVKACIETVSTTTIATQTVQTLAVHSLTS